MTAHGNGLLLPIPDDSRLVELAEVWPSWAAMGTTRSVWLGEAERILRDTYPLASSRDLSRTARSIAPFPLAEPNTG